MGFAFVLLLLSIGFFCDTLKDRSDVFSGIIGFICMFLSGVFFALTIIRIILWARGEI
jgi:hypothetical protein